MRTRRLFVAVWPPDEVASAAAQWRDECQRMLPRGLTRYVPDHQLHLIFEGVNQLRRVRRPRVEWRIKGIRLMRSDLGPAGPRYEIEAEMPLDRTVNPGGVGDG